MRVTDYQIKDAGRSVWTQMKAFSEQHPFRAARLTTALEEFVLNDTEFAFCVLPEKKQGSVEVYMIPPRYVVMHIPDAAALVRVDHTNRTIELVEMFEDYGGFGEEKQWQDLSAAAQRHL